MSGWECEGRGKRNQGGKSRNVSFELQVPSNSGAGALAPWMRNER